MSDMTAHAFNPSPEKSETHDSLYEFEAILVYIVSSRPVKTT